ncbi:MAG: methylenetetrahydrofolate reductase [Acidimicrobiales bacterium]
MTKISEHLSGDTPTFSIELLPPRSEAAERRLEQVLVELEPLHPLFTSITYGAGGSTRERTHELVVRLRHHSPMTPMAHLVCAEHTRGDLDAILSRYRAADVDNILALHGDPPLDAVADQPEGELRHALDLVELAREVGDFCIAVAAHPEGHPRSPDLATDRRFLAAKLDAADFAITQFFFHPQDYLQMVEDLAALGVDKPVIPGIMPITSYKTVAKMAQLSGTEVPVALRNRLEAVADQPEEVARIGVEVATDLGDKLLAEGVPGLHVYTRNQAQATKEIHSNLGFSS